jgi:hypothetical protein
VGRWSLVVSLVLELVLRLVLELVLRLVLGLLVGLSLLWLLLELLAPVLASPCIEARRPWFELKSMPLEPFPWPDTLHSEPALAQEGRPMPEQP